MALDALWAVLIPEVSRVSQVQASIHAGLRDTPTFLPEVLGVSSNDSSEDVTTFLTSADTPATPPENVRYQAQPAWTLGCTLDTPDTPEKINTTAHATNDLLLGEQLTAALTEPKRVFGQHGPWLTDTEQSEAHTYHTHHFNCNTCIATGRGIRYSNRCAVGLTLWNTYQGSDGITG